MREQSERKYVVLRVLKSIQEYLKSPDNGEKALYPIYVPNDFLIQILEHQGPDFTDHLIHEIFRAGLKAWADQLYSETFGSTTTLEAFIEEVKQGQH